MPHTVLYVPVPELEPYIRWRHEVEGPEWLSPDPAHLHAHVTVLGPFVPPESLTVDLEAELLELFASVEPFAFSLEEVRVFPSGLVYLHPEPATEFATLTAALAARYPEYPPYAGEFAPVPHLSLCAVGPGRDVDLVERELAELLPVRAVAREVRLAVYAERATRTLRSYPLGAVTTSSGEGGRATGVSVPSPTWGRRQAARARGLLCRCARGGRVAP